MSDILKRFQLFWRQIGLKFILGINDFDSKKYQYIKMESDSHPQTYEFSDSDSLTFIYMVKETIASRYDEAVYSLFTAFPRKIVNKHAVVHHEFEHGRGAVDLCVKFKGRQYLVEVKLHGQKYREDSLEHLAGYLDVNGENEGWLVVFNRNKTWDEKITWETVQFNKNTIHIVCC
ncbi:MAG: hypothetical protein LBR53_09155 [Deltaproteobacteria bacterium]|jgi:hypothetical protein|nr:hypothetical protein [Deltaproteobacteria bacterium]